VIFRKKTPPPLAREEPILPPIDRRVLETLERLQKAGVQLLVRIGGPDVFTSEVVGLGRDAFFIDTLSPPEGDPRVRPGLPVEVETLYQGITHKFHTQVVSKVQFVDELPAFKLAYPEDIQSTRRRQSPRIDTHGDASLSFLHPFSCDAPVVNLSEGGLAFEYDVELGRLRRGTVIREILLEVGAHPVVTVQGRVVGNLVAELGGIGLPRRYRGSLAFQGLTDVERTVIAAYLAELKGMDGKI
jgi:hypothetical protein